MVNSFLRRFRRSNFRLWALDLQSSHFRVLCINSSSFQSCSHNRHELISWTFYYIQIFSRVAYPSNCQSKKCKGIRLIIFSKHFWSACLSSTFDTLFCSFKRSSNYINSARNYLELSQRTKHRRCSNRFLLARHWWWCFWKLCWGSWFLLTLHPQLSHHYNWTYKWTTIQSKVQSSQRLWMVWLVSYCFKHCHVWSSRFSSERASNFIRSQCCHHLGSSNKHRRKWNLADRLSNINQSKVSSKFCPDFFLHFNSLNSDMLNSNALP